VELVIELRVSYLQNILATAFATDPVHFPLVTFVDGFLSAIYLAGIEPPSS
jgi:hypothetical protein